MAPKLLQIGFVKDDIFGPFGQDKKDHFDNAEYQVAVGDDKKPIDIRIGHPQWYQRCDISEADQYDIEIGVFYQTCHKNSKIYGKIEFYQENGVQNFNSL